MPRLTPVHYRKLAKVFERKGFIYVRTHGDHLVYQKKGIARPIIIPMYREIPEFIILKNLKTAGITRKEYLKILGEN
jgi:predicted RNA binding protein YcfA (HicA-like mRNA interferase family)